MERNFDAFTKTTFDLAVIGGGINGAATAREAALRGLKVALVEAADFAGATSSRSSKLIHGGLRYLGQFDFRLVHEARRERRILLECAPHLVRPLPFLLPIYQGDPYSPLKIRWGLTIYDLFGNLGRKDRHRMLDPADALRVVPSLRSEGLRAAAIYHDSATDDARLTLENIIDAANHGAVVANYADVRALALSAATGAQGGKVVSGEVEDRLTGRKCEISARFWVNATGPWVDHVRALVPGFDGSQTVRLTKGTHLILPAVEREHALFAAIPPGERVFVMMPWQGHSLLGTTDTDYEGDPGSVQPDTADLEYLLTAANRVLRKPLEANQVLGSFAGLRALAIEPGRTPSANTREYRFHRDPWARNFFSICGGKLTTARALGEKLVAQILALPGVTAAERLSGPSTRKALLPGGQTGSFDIFVNYASWEAVRQFGIPLAVAERIVKTYGSRWRQVLEPIDDNKRLAQTLPGSPALLAAEVEFALRHEMALTLEDFLLRRSGLNWLAANVLREAAPTVAELFAKHFGWSVEHQEAALNGFLRTGSASVRD